MSEQDVETIRGAYGEFNSGNPRVLERLDAEVAWIEPGGGNAPSGTFNGPQSVGDDVFSAIPQYFDEFSAEPENYDDQGDTDRRHRPLQGQGEERRRSSTPPSSTSSR